MNSEQNQAPVENGNVAPVAPAPVSTPAPTPTAAPAPVAAAPVEGETKKAGIPPLVIIAAVAIIGYLVYFFLIK